IAHKAPCADKTDFDLLIPVCPKHTSQVRADRNVCPPRITAPSRSDSPFSYIRVSDADMTTALRFGQSPRPRQLGCPGFLDAHAGGLAVDHLEDQVNDAAGGLIDGDASGVDVGDQVA